jgi:hypothetical protein
MCIGYKTCIVCILLHKPSLIGFCHDFSKHHHPSKTATQKPLLIFQPVKLSQFKGKQQTLSLPL